VEAPHGGLRARALPQGIYSRGPRKPAAAARSATRRLRLHPSHDAARGCDVPRRSWCSRARWLSQPGGSA